MCANGEDDRGTKGDVRDATQNEKEDSTSGARPTVYSTTALRRKGDNNGASGGGKR